MAAAEAGRGISPCQRVPSVPERVIGAGLFAPRKPTLMFNGYGEQVAHLYEGLDLRKNY